MVSSKDRFRGFFKGFLQPYSSLFVSLISHKFGSTTCTRNHRCKPTRNYRGFYSGRVRLANREITIPQRFVEWDQREKVVAPSYFSGRDTNKSTKLGFELLPTE